MGRVRTYRDLRVYREGFRLAMDLMGLLRTFPEYEKYDLVRQARRSSRSVCANLAEAWRRRRYPAALVAKIIDAEAEASETRVHLEFAAACGYISDEVAAAFDDRYDRLLAQLTSMRSRPDRWSPRPKVREAPHAPAESADAARRARIRSAPANAPEAVPREQAGDPGTLQSRDGPSTDGGRR